MLIFLNKTSYHFVNTVFYRLLA